MPCKIIMNAKHLRDIHGLNIPEPMQFFRKVQGDSDKIGTRVYRMMEIHSQIGDIVRKIHQFLEGCQIE